MMIETTNLYILVSIWSQNFMRKQQFWCLFSRKCRYRLWMKFSLLSQPVGFLKLMLNSFSTSIIEGRELCWCGCMKYAFNIVMCQDTCEPICFKLGVMLNTAEFYSLIPVWMILVFTQGQRVAGNRDLVQSFCCEAAWGNSNIRDGWLYNVDDFEKVM